MGKPVEVFSWPMRRGPLLRFAELALAPASGRNANGALAITIRPPPSTGACSSRRATSRPCIASCAPAAPDRGLRRAAAVGAPPARRYGARAVAAIRGLFGPDHMARRGRPPSIAGRKRRRYRGVHDEQKYACRDEMTIRAHRRTHCEIPAPQPAQDLPPPAPGVADQARSGRLDVAPGVAPSGSRRCASSSAPSRPSTGAERIFVWSVEKLARPAARVYEISTYEGT
mgnify:CR=1 FL=1